MLDNELAQIMAMAQSAHNQAAATFAPAPATALAAPLTPQICVRQTITECRPFAAPGAPPRYGGALLAVIQNGGSAAVNNTGLRIGIDAAIAEFPPEIRAFLTANNGHFPPAYILINPFSSIHSHQYILTNPLLSLHSHQSILINPFSSHHSLFRAKASTSALRLTSYHRLSAVCCSCPS